jgi:hypothetical protein
LKLRPGEPGVSAGKGRIEIDSLLKESLRTSVVVWIGFAHVPEAALIGGPGV